MSKEQKNYELDARKRAGSYIADDVADIVIDFEKESKDRLNELNGGDNDGRGRKEFNDERTGKSVDGGRGDSERNIKSDKSIKKHKTKWDKYKY